MRIILFNREQLIVPSTECSCQWWMIKKWKKVQKWAVLKCKYKHINYLTPSLVVVGLTVKKNFDRKYAIPDKKFIFSPQNRRDNPLLTPTSKKIFCSQWIAITCKQRHLNNMYALILQYPVDLNASIIH